MICALTGAALVAAGQALAGPGPAKPGLSALPKSASESAHKSASRWPRASLLETAGTARYRLTASVDLFMAGFDEPSRAVIARSLAPTAASLWPQFATGALQVRHQSGDDGETLWFNPVFDTGLLLRWRYAQNGWTVSDGWWISGSDLRAEPAGTEPPLAIGRGDRTLLAHRLSSDAAKVFRTATAARWRAPGVAPLAAARALDRIKAARTALDQMPAAPGYGDSVWHAREILVHGGPTTPGIGPHLRKLLGQLGTTAQNSMRSVSAFRNKTGWTLVMQSPDAPGAAWFVAFADPVAKAPATIISVTKVSYGAKEIRP